MLILCDYHWSNLSNLRYAFVGGRCDHVLNNGLSIVDVYCSPSHMTWVVGACDDYWSYPSDLQYALVGGTCKSGLYCGLSYLYVRDFPWIRNWDFGACLVIVSHVISMMALQ